MKLCDFGPHQEPGRRRFAGDLDISGRTIAPRSHQTIQQLLYELSHLRSSCCSLVPLLPALVALLAVAAAPDVVDAPLSSVTVCIRFGLLGLALSVETRFELLHLDLHHVADYWTPQLLGGEHGTQRHVYEHVQFLE